MALKGIAVAETDDNPVTIAEVLSGRARLTAPMKITSGQRLSYNYRFHEPSFEREVRGLRPSTPSGDFRSERERQKDGQ